MAIAPLLAPAVEVTAEALLVPLSEVLIFVVALGLIYTTDYWVRALFGTAEGVIGWLPFGGKVVSHSLNKIEQKVHHALGSAAAPLDKRMGAAMHKISDTVVGVGQEIYAIDVMMRQLVDHLVRVWAVPTLKHQLGRLGHDTTIVKYITKNVYPQIASVAGKVNNPSVGKIGAAIRAQVRSVAVELDGFRHWTIPRVKAAERAIERDIPHDVASLRARDKAIARSLDRLWARVRGLDKVTAGAITGALVATMLGRLGAGWIRCRNWNRIGRAGCRIPLGVIEGLLEGAIAALTVVELCRYAQLAQAVARQVAPALAPILLAQDAVCLGGGATYPSAYTDPAGSRTITEPSAM